MDRVLAFAFLGKVLDLESPLGPVLVLGLTGESGIELFLAPPRLGGATGPLGLSLLGGNGGLIV